MIGGGRWGTLAAGLLLVGALTAGTVTSADAVGGGTPGYCPTRTGVTVVVDFQELGGGIVVRCAPGPVVPGYSGLDALQDAGFTPTGVRQYGLAFICRIAGKPAADQTLPIEGDPDYREDCNQTPPQAAFWGYWYAPNGGSWTYSQLAAINRDAIEGGFEGWSFSLNHASGDAPAPGIAPKRPPRTPPTTPPTTTPPPPPTTSPTTSPTPPPTTAPTHSSPSQQSPTHQPTGPGSGWSASAGSGHPTATSTQTAQPPASHKPERRPGSAIRTSAGGASSPTTESPVDNPVAAGHNAAGEQVSGELPDASSSDSGSATTAVLGIGLVTLLAAGGGMAAWRRRAGRE